MSTVSGVARRSRLSAPYATAAGRRLRSRRLRRGDLLPHLATVVWESSWLVRQVLIAALVFVTVFGLLRAPWSVLSGLQGQVRHYLTADYDLRGAVRQVTSGELSSKVSEGWRVFPELWDRLTGRGKAAAPTPTEATFILPVAGTVTSTFGYRPDPVTGEISFHTGLDIAAAEGAPVVATLGGTVLSTREDTSYGKVIEIDHGTGAVSLYAHCKDILVKEGDTVKQGQSIASVGMTGKATLPHCHFELIVSGQPVDPLQMKGLATPG